MSKETTTVSMIQSKMGFLQRTNDPIDAMSIVRGIQKELEKLVASVNGANEQLTDLYAFLSENRETEMGQAPFDQKFKEQIDKAFATLEEIFWN